MDEIDPNKAKSLLSRLVNSIDWHGVSFFNLGKVVSKLFSTSDKRVGNRVEIDTPGFRIYDNYGNLVLWISSDVNAVDPADPSTVTGTGMFLNTLRSISTSLNLLSKIGKASLLISDANNGRFTFIGDNGSGNLQVTFIPGTGYVFSHNGAAVTLASGGITLDQNILMQALKKIGSVSSFVRFVESTPEVVLSANGVQYEATENEFKIPSGKALQLGNTYVATPPTPSGYIIINDETGTPYKVAVEA